jgi:hypothetical protein
MTYESLDGYEKPKAKRINSKLTLVIYRPKKEWTKKLEVVVGLDHHYLREKKFKEPILLNFSTLSKVVDELGLAGL